MPPRNRHPSLCGDLSVLPAEICLMVLQHLDPRDLERAMRLNSHWFDMCIERRWRHASTAYILASSPDRMQKYAACVESLHQSYIRNRRPQQYSILCSLSFPRLQMLLNVHVEFATEHSFVTGLARMATVRELGVAMWWPSDPSTMPLMEAITQFTNLEQLSLSFKYPDGPFAIGPTTGLPGLKSASIEYMSEIPLTLLQVISKCPDLESLRLSNAIEGRGLQRQRLQRWVSEASPFFPKLYSLDVCLGDAAPLLDISGIHSLTSLTIRFDSPLVQPEHLLPISGLHNLQILNITHYTDRPPFTSFNVPPSWFSSLLGPLCNLKHFQTSGIMCPYETAVDKCLVHVALAAPTLTYLSLDCAVTLPTSEPVGLYAPGRIPVLEHLRVSGIRYFMENPTNNPGNFFSYCNAMDMLSRIFPRLRMYEVNGKAFVCYGFYRRPFNI